MIVDEMIAPRFKYIIYHMNDNLIKLNTEGEDKVSEYFFTQYKT